MNIVFLAAASSIHTLRWVNALAKKGHKITLISLHSCREKLHPTIQFVPLPIPAPWGYFLNAPKLKRLLKSIQPDLVHAHYASGYGTLARHSGFHPTLLSVWGSDVYEFPTSSRYKQYTLKANLAAADALASTSQVMKIHTLSYAKGRDIAVTPFGIDTQVFHPPKVAKTGPFRLGTVKALAPKYGIDTLIRAFALARLQGLPQDSELIIIGEGSQAKALKHLSKELHIQTHVDFKGWIPHQQIPQALAQMDLYLALSTQESESFGVAILEASATGLPVVVSQVGGLPEVVQDQKTGFIVPPHAVEAATEKILWLYQHPQLAKKMGRAGREWVLEKFAWPLCLAKMEHLYEKVIHDFE